MHRMDMRLVGGDAKNPTSPRKQVCKSAWIRWDHFYRSYWHRTVLIQVLQRAAPLVLSTVSDVLIHPMRNFFLSAPGIRAT